MDWEIKKDIIQAHNKNLIDDFKKLVIDNLNHFDEQGWDIFFTCVQLTHEHIKTHFQFYKTIYDKIQTLKGEFDLDWRAMMRAGMFLTIVEELEAGHE